MATSEMKWQAQKNARSNSSRMYTSEVKEALWYLDGRNFRFVARPRKWVGMQKRRRKAMTWCTEYNANQNVPICGDGGGILT